MRTLIFIATASLLMWPYALAQEGPGRGGPGRGGAGRGGNQAAPATPSTPPPAGLECVEHLQMPEYPSSALNAHVDGSVWTWVQVTPQGSASNIQTQVVSAWGEGPKLLTPPVEKALQATKYKTDCAGKTVGIVYRYQLHGQPTANPKVTTKTENPNLVWIESEPAATASATNTKK